MLDNLNKKLGLHPEPSIFHLHISEKFKEKVNYPDVTIIDLSIVTSVLWHNDVPKKHRFKFLKEMEQAGLIKFKNRRKIEIL